MALTDDDEVTKAERDFDARLRGFTFENCDHNRGEGHLPWVVCRRCVFAFVQATEYRQPQPVAVTGPLVCSCGAASQGLNVHLMGCSAVTGPTCDGSGKLSYNTARELLEADCPGCSRCRATSPGTAPTTEGGGCVMVCCLPWPHRHSRGTAPTTCGEEFVDEGGFLRDCTLARGHGGECASDARSP